MPPSKFRGSRNLPALLKCEKRYFTVEEIWNRLTYKTMIRTYAEVLLYIMAGHFFKCLIMFSISEVSKYERADTPKCALTSLHHTYSV